MDHLEFARLESQCLEPTPWEKWINELERLVGHSLDGDQAEDGYSLDRCFDLYHQRFTPKEAQQDINWQRSIRGLSGTVTP